MFQFGSSMTADGCTTVRHSGRPKGPADEGSLAGRTELAAVLRLQIVSSNLLNTRHSLTTNLPFFESQDSSALFTSYHSMRALI